MSQDSSKRKCVNSQTRETIAKVYDFLSKDAKEIINIINDPECREKIVLISKLNTHLNRVRRRTAEAVGVSERTISNILTERRNSNFKTPFKNRKKRAKLLELNDFNVNIIRTTIKSYQLEHHKFPSLLKLQKLLSEKLNYKGSVSTLRQVLLKLGYKLRQPAEHKRIAL